MGGYHSFYGGSTYGLGPKYSEYAKSAIAPDMPFSSFAMATDPRTAAQLKAVSEKLNSGAKTMEVSMLFPGVEESIPDQHLEEINRLRKLVGADLTLHGPLVEPTGFNPQQGNWDETLREQAERTMWSALKRGNKINKDNPGKPLVVTFHSSNGMITPETKIFDDKAKPGEKEKTIRIAVVDERTGRIGQLPVPPEDYLDGVKGEKGEKKIQNFLDDYNRKAWHDPLTDISQGLAKADEYLQQGFKVQTADEYNKLKGMSEEQRKSFYGDLDKELPGGIGEQPKRANELITHAKVLVENSYDKFKELYNQAYEAAEKKDPNGENMKKLNDIKQKISEVVKNRKNMNVTELKGVVGVLTDSISILDNFADNYPVTYKPLREFALDKSAETFGNLAFKSYKEFKDNAPVISIENPPAGDGLFRAQDLKDMIERSRNKFAKYLIEKENMSKEEANSRAKKAIGATWDVGHINMIRKFGYGDEQLEQEAKTIAKYVNKIHLSDNFGLEHTELPMGMGNVPIEAHMKQLREAHGEKLKEIKQIIEVGNWNEHFKTWGFGESLASYGTPIGGGGWNQYLHTQGGYFSGLGYNPEIHHSIYGSGFTGLPLELGGQMQGRSRFSGAPIE